MTYLSTFGPVRQATTVPVFGPPPYVKVYCVDVPRSGSDFDACSGTELTLAGYVGAVRYPGKLSDLEPAAVFQAFEDRSVNPTDGRKQRFFCRSSFALAQGLRQAHERCQIGLQEAR